MTPPRRLGDSAVAVSPLGLGTTPLGNLRIDVVFVHDPDDHIAAALDEALAIGAGMNSEPRPAVDDRARYNYQQAPEQLVEDVGHVGAAISSQLWGALVDEGPLPADAPTPTSLAT
jgi:hypothetical protein